MVGGSNHPSYLMTRILEFIYFPTTPKKQQNIYSKTSILPIMETITMPKAEIEQLHRELETLRNSSLYKRLLEFEKNISEGKRFTRADLGF